MTERTAGFGGTADTALRYFRADVPAKGLRRYNWRVDVEPLVICERTGPDGRFKPWNGVSRPWPEYPTVMVLRATNDFSWATDTHGTLIDDVARARDAGQIVVLDLDDDLWHIPEWSEAAKSVKGVHAPVDLPMLDKLVAAVNAVTVSTPRIASVVADRAPSAQTWLMRNGIDITDFYPHEPTEGRRLRVGWMGGARFHGPHLRTMLEALDVLPAHDAEFIHMGWIPERADDSDELSDAIRAVAPGIVLGWMDWMPYSKLRQALAHIDIGIIPRMPDEFHEAQSTSSGMAYAAAGVPFIAQGTGEYRRFADEGAGIIASTVDDWRGALDLLLSSEEAREGAARRGYRAVSLCHGVGRVGNDWRMCLETLVADA